MPRANRYFLPDHVWHITHRCHKKAFLLKFAKDRKRWLHWLFEARKRFGLCVLNYITTSNHIHLLVRDRGQSAEFIFMLRWWLSSISTSCDVSFEIARLLVVREVRITPFNIQYSVKHCQDIF